MPKGLYPKKRIFCKDAGARMLEKFNLSSISGFSLTPPPPPPPPPIFPKWPFKHTGKCISPLSICWYLRVLLVLYNPEVVDIVVNII